MRQAWQEIDVDMWGIAKTIPPRRSLETRATRTCIFGKEKEQVSREKNHRIVIITRLISVYLYLKQEYPLFHHKPQFPHRQSFSLRVHPIKQSIRLCRSKERLVPLEPPSDLDVRKILPRQLTRSRLLRRRGSMNIKNLTTPHFIRLDATQTGPRRRVRVHPPPQLFHARALPVLGVFFCHLGAGRDFVYAQHRDVHAWEPVREGVGLEFGFRLCEGVRVRGTLFCGFVDGEVVEVFEGAVGVDEADGVDGGDVGEAFDACFGGRTHAYEGRVYVVGVDDVVVFVDGVGDRGEVDYGVAAVEGVDRRFVVGG